MAFGENLAILRKSKGLSQEQLAEKLNLTGQTISKWELNQSTPDVNLLLQLSDIFQVSTDYLIKGEKEERKDSLNDEPETSNNRSFPIHTQGIAAYKWCFYSGSVIVAISLIGMIALVICSALHPWTASVNNIYFEGLLGFLFGTNTLWFFIVLLVLLLLGCCIAVYGIVKNKKLQTGK